MKLKTVAIAAAALALAVGMTACGGAASTAASSTASSAAASSEAASSEVASSEAEATSAEYTVYNTTGSKVTELYLYDAGSEDKGENLLTARASSSPAMSKLTSRMTLSTSWSSPPRTATPRALTPCTTKWLPSL